MAVLSKLPGGLYNALAFAAASESPAELSLAAKLLMCIK